MSTYIFVSSLFKLINCTLHIYLSCCLYVSVSLLMLTITSLKYFEYIGFLTNFSILCMLNYLKVSGAGWVFTESWTLFYQLLHLSFSISNQYPWLLCFVYVMYVDDDNKDISYLILSSGCCFCVRLM